MRNIICLLAILLSAATSSAGFTSTGYSAGPSLGDYPLTVIYGGEERLIYGALVSWTITGEVFGDTVTFDSIQSSLSATDCMYGSDRTDCTYINLSGILHGSIGSASIGTNGAIMFPPMSGSVTFGGGTWSEVSFASPGLMTASYWPSFTNLFGMHNDASLSIDGYPLWSNVNGSDPFQSMSLLDISGGGLVTSVPEPRSWVMMLVAMSCAIVFAYR